MVRDRETDTSCAPLVTGRVGRGVEISGRIASCHRASTQLEVTFLQMDAACRSALYTVIEWLHSDSSGLREKRIR